MTDKQEFGIGLVGLGIGQQHLLGYQRQDLPVVAICDKDTARLNEVGDRFGIDKRYTRIADLIADNDVDVIDMAVQPWIRSPHRQSRCRGWQTHPLPKTVLNVDATSRRNGRNL